MKKLELFVVVIVLVSGCQYNSLEPAFDCDLSTLKFSAVILNTDCGLNSGKITISASEGEQPYSYALNDEAMQDSPVFEGLSAGEYTITVVDNLGCSIESIGLVSNKNGITVSAIATNSDCLTDNGMITVSATNGVEPYEYQLGNEPPQSSNIFVAGPGNHEIIVLDAIGCGFTLSHLVNSNTSFAANVQPVIANSCSVFGCHDGSNSSLPNYTNFSELQADASMVKSRTQSGNMPKTGSLTQEQIDLIACWVDDGAKDN